MANKQDLCNGTTPRSIYSGRTFPFNLTFFLNIYAQNVLTPEYS